MELAVQQRADIAEVVEKHIKRRPDRLAAEPVDAPKAPHRWYVVIDEIVETNVRIEYWPWPAVDPETRFLSFDLARGGGVTLRAGALHDVVAALRDADPADRPLRVGDVFEVTTRHPRDPDSWEVLVDHTEQKRAEAQAAMHAMATPPHFDERIRELERLGQDIQQRDVATIKTSPAQAFPAV